MIAFDKAIALFDEQTMTLVEKGLVRIARWKLYHKLKSLCWEHKIDALVELMTYCKDHLQDIERAVNRIKALNLHQRKRGPDGIFLAEPAKEGTGQTP